MTSVVTLAVEAVASVDVFESVTVTDPVDCSFRVLTASSRRRLTVVVAEHVSVLLGQAAVSVAEASVASDAASVATVTTKLCVSSVCTVTMAVARSSEESAAVAVKSAAVATSDVSTEARVVVSLREKATCVRVEYGGEGGGAEGGGGGTGGGDGGGGL